MARGTESSYTPGWDDGKKQPEAPKPPEYWEKATKPKPPPKPGMKRWKKVTLFGGGGLLLVVLVLLAAAPTIAGSLAPGIISSNAAEQIKGPVSVASADFSWSGKQKIGPVTILDPTKPSGSNQVATVTVEIDSGLMGLVSAGLGGAIDIREIKVSGSAKIVRYADGTTNLDRALEPVKAAIKKPASGGSKEPARLAKGTKASLVIDAIDFSYIDETSPQSNAALKGLKGDVTIAPDGAGTSARIKLAAKASSGGAGGATGTEGTITIDIKAEQIADASGIVQADKAKLDATIDVGGLPTALIDSLAGMGGKLAAGLGPTLGVNIGAKGSMKNAAASVKVVSTGATVSGGVQMTDSVLTTTTPLVATLTDAAVRSLGGLDEALAKSGSTKLTKAPSVTVSVDSLRVKLPASGAKFDLAGGTAKVSLKTTEMAGTLKLQDTGAPSEFKVSPIEATIASDDLAGAVKLVASGNATIGGQPAGALSADVTANNVMGFAKGGGGAAPSLQGTVQLKGVATPIAQPFVAAAGLDLARDVGPTLDAEVKIATAASGVGAGSVPPVTAELMLASAKLNARGGFELKDSALRSAGGPFTLNADSVGGLIARFVDPAAAYTVAPGGKLTVAVSDVNVPFKDGDLGKAQLDKAGLKVQVNATGLAVTPSRPGATGNLDVTTFALGIIAAPGAAPKLELNGAMAFGGKPFTMAGAMEVPGFYSFKADGSPTVTPVAARPSGTIELKNVPTGIASLFAMAKGDGAERFALIESATVNERLGDGSVVVAWSGEASVCAPPSRHAIVAAADRRVSGPFGSDAIEQVPQEARLPLPPGQVSGPSAPPMALSPVPAAKPAAPRGPSLDMGRFLGDAIGPTVDVKLVSGAAKSTDGVDLGLSVRAERLSADVQAALSDKAVDIKRVGVDATVAPNAMETVLATYAPNIVPRPQLAGTSKLTLSVDPVSIPVGRDKDGAARLDLARAGIAVIKLSLPQQTLLQKMVLKNSDGTTTDLGQLGVEGFDVTAKIPLAAADPATTAAQKFDVTLAGRALDGPGSVLLRISGAASGEMAGSGVRSGDANFAITDVRVASIDRLLGKPGYVSGAIGDSAAVNLDAKIRAAASGTGTTTEAVLAVQSPRVKMLEPLRVTMLADRVKSDRPVQIGWTMEPAWANQYVFAPPPGGGKDGAPTSLKAPVNVNVTINKFVASTGEGRGPLLASVFDLAAGVTLSAMEFAMPDGTTIRLAGTRADVQSAPGGLIAGDKSGAQSAGVAFDLKVDEVSVKQVSGGAAGGGGAAPPAKGVALNGRIEGLSDAAGNVSAKTAAVSATGDIPAIPTALIDLLARQNGLLVDALGPTASAQIHADRFSANGGTLDLVAKSERASASVRGSVGGGVFVTSEPIKASLTEVTAALAKRFIKGMPLVGSVEKKATDEPALITASTMRVPMDNDMRKLEGEIVIDPGVARFTSGESFGKILKALNQKTEANIGQRIDPLNVHIKQGIATYDKWNIPIGQNRLNTQGTVDLVNETVDVITYVPLGALTEDVAGLFKAQAKLKQALGGKGLEDTLMVPFRSRGGFGNVKTEPDMELFAKETINNLLKPDDLIKKGLGDLLKPKPKPEGGGK